jgi:tetratricopeptide (TPR) repeat protein
MTPQQQSAILAVVQELQVAVRQKKREQQKNAIEQLVALRAQMGAQWQAIANIALQIGELSLAREAIDCLVETEGDTSLARYHKALLLEQCGDLDGAYALLRTVSRDTPDAATHAYSRGVTALYLGETEEAQNEFERATRLQPRMGVAWLMLATSVDLGSEPEVADRLVAARRDMEQAAPAERASYQYALGKAFADRGDHASAFAAFSRGAGTMKSLVPYSSAKDRRAAAEAVRGYSAESLAAMSSCQPAPSERTIFVTGLPRSGTTLVTQILTGHSEVSGGAETNRLVLLAKEIGGHSAAALRRYVGARGAPEAADLLRYWMDQRFPQPGRVVDKSLTTTRLIGLAAALLPGAPLIWLRRDPLDCAWSCFRTFLQGNMPWSHDLADIALHFRLEDELLRQWQAILGDRLLVVPYENHVTDSATWIGRILAHCGLAAEAQVFAPHENPHGVTTASATQVRRPIHRQGIGSAEPYRAYLKPFLDAYLR